MSVACVLGEKTSLDSFLGLEIGVDAGFPFSGEEEWGIVKFDEKRAVCWGCGEKIGNVKAGSLDIEVGVRHCEVLNFGFGENRGLGKDVVVGNIYI